MVCRAVALHFPDLHFVSRLGARPACWRSPPIPLPTGLLKWGFPPPVAGMSLFVWKEIQNVAFASASAFAFAIVSVVAFALAFVHAFVIVLVVVLVAVLGLLWLYL